MSWRYRRRPKTNVDRNQGLIIAALRDVGASVQSLASVGEGVPDLLVGYRGSTHLLEVKREVETFPGRQRAGRRSVKPSDVKLRETQERWHRSWRGLAVAVVHTPAEALRAIGILKGSEVIVCEHNQLGGCPEDL